MKKAALFVGINDYQKPITSLKCARKDAETLYRLFLDQYSPGLVDFLHDVDSDKIITVVKKTMAQLEKGDLFFFYFSGHGVEEKNNHYLLSSKAELLGGEWLHYVSINMLKDLTRKRGVQTVFVIDSCRESIYYGTRSLYTADKARSITMQKLVNDDAVQKSTYLPPVIICSCAGGERAFELEEEGHGIFTLALKECLETRKFSTVDEIVDNVSNRLKILIERFKLAGNQTPEIYKAPTVNPVLWGNVEEKQLLADYSDKPESVDKSSIDKDYGKLYGKVESILEYDNFQWKEEFEQRLESCERIYNAGLKQEALLSLRDLFEWHKRNNLSEKKQPKKEPAEKRLLPEQDLPEEKHTEAETVTISSEPKVETEKNAAKKRRIESFWFAGILSSIIVMTAAICAKDDYTIGVVFLVVYSIFHFVRSFPFMIYNILMVTFCLALFYNAWFWFAVGPVALIAGCVLIATNENVPQKNKRFNFTDIYLILVQAVCLYIVFKNFNCSLAAIAVCLFFSTVYIIPRTVISLAATICGILAIHFTPWWWLGTALFLIILLGVCSNLNEKKATEEAIQK